MSLDHILLGMLRQPSTGYDIKNRFKNDIRVFWSAELSQIYPTLKRLEKNGWLRSRTEPSPKGPARRVYRPTAAGRAELTRWLRSGPILGSERFAYLAQLFFMDALGNVEETRGFLLKLRESLRHWLAIFKSWRGRSWSNTETRPTGIPTRGYTVLQRCGWASLDQRESDVVRRDAQRARHASRA